MSKQVMLTLWNFSMAYSQSVQGRKRYTYTSNSEIPIICFIYYLKQKRHYDVTMSPEDSYEVVHVSVGILEWRVSLLAQVGCGMSDVKPYRLQNTPVYAFNPRNTFSENCTTKYKSFCLDIETIGTNIFVWNLA